MERDGRKILLFGFETLPEILRVRDTAEEFGAELIPVGRSDYGKTLSELAGLEEDGGGEAALPIPGRMAVLCGLEDRLDELLPALAKAGAGANCLKAVLTRHNRGWSAARLYGELEQERDAIRREQA